MNKKSEITVGITLGNILAAILSFTVNHSIFWCIVHFFCSWVYVVYYALVYAL